MQQDRKSLVLLSGFVLTAAALGFAGTFMLLSASARGTKAPQLSKDQIEGRASFEANLKKLDSIHKHVLTHYQNKSSYPLSAQMQAVSVALGSEFTDQAGGKYGGSYLYWSETGRDYKLIAIGTGDCAIARELRPEMADPTRSWGPFDCNAYGYWTAGGKAK
jgi:hypothetical protein